MAATQSYALAINNLGSLQEDGQSVAPSKVMAYALNHVSASMSPGPDNQATFNRNEMASNMTPALMDAALLQIRDINNYGNVSASLTAKSLKPTVFEVPSVAVK